MILSFNSNNNGNWLKTVTVYKPLTASPLLWFSHYNGMTMQEENVYHYLVVNILYYHVLTYFPFYNILSYEME